MVVHKEVIWQGVWMWAGKVLKECLELCKNGIDNGMLLSTSKQWLEGFDMNSSADQAMIAGNWQGLWGWPDNDCRELTGYVGLIRQWLQRIDRDSGAEKAMIAGNWQGLWGWEGNDCKELTGTLGLTRQLLVVFDRVFKYRLKALGLTRARMYLWISYIWLSIQIHI